MGGEKNNQRPRGIYSHQKTLKKQTITDVIKLVFYILNIYHLYKTQCSVMKSKKCQYELQWDDQKKWFRESQSIETEHSSSLKGERAVGEPDGTADWSYLVRCSEANEAVSAVLKAYTNKQPPTVQKSWTHQKCLNHYTHVAKSNTGGEGEKSTTSVVWSTHLLGMTTVERFSFKQKGKGWVKINQINEKYHARNYVQE